MEGVDGGRGGYASPNRLRLPAGRGWRTGDKLSTDNEG